MDVTRGLGAVGGVMICCRVGVWERRQVRVQLVAVVGEAGSKEARDFAGDVASDRAHTQPKEPIGD